MIKKISAGGFNHYVNPEEVAYIRMTNPATGKSIVDDESEAYLKAFGPVEIKIEIGLTGGETWIGQTSYYSAREAEEAMDAIAEELFKDTSVKSIGRRMEKFVNG
jgi:hypothetical protein